MEEQARPKVTTPAQDRAAEEVGAAEEKGVSGLSMLENSVIRIRIKFTQQ